MKNIIKPLALMYFLVALCPVVHPASAQEIDEWDEPDAVLVGRISHVEGDLSRYDTASDQWVSTTREAPFGMDDLLRTDSDARAEIILPNNTWVRIDGDTRIQLTSLTAQTTEVDLPVGMARFYNKSTETEISATTPYGRISAPPEAVFDLFVADDGVEIIAVRNSVYFHHNASGRRHEVRSDSSALFADMQEITAVDGEGVPEWADWNQRMDDLWAERMDTRGESASYLPPELRSEAYALDTHGHWERVYYEGHYYRFWRPIHISAGWSPFSWGAWVVWHGDHVWIPHEPFGYVTHHYGNWIFAVGHWYWAPPVTHIMVRARLPLLHIGFAWYPGRVSWIYSGAYVGWIPLAPYEPYYTHRHWGRRSIAADRWKGSQRHRHVYRHRGHSVIIHRSHLYRSNDYRHLRVRDVSHRIGKGFRSARVLDRKILKDHQSQEKYDRFRRSQGRGLRGTAEDTRRVGGRNGYVRHFGVKRSAKQREVRPSKVRRPEEKHGKTASKRIRPVPYERRANRSRPTITRTNEGRRQHHQIRNQRSKERRTAVIQGREQRRANKKMNAHGRHPQANRQNENPIVWKNTNIRSHRNTVSRHRERAQSTGNPPVFHRRPQQAESKPIISERSDRVSSVRQQRQERSRPQWQPSPGRQGGDRRNTQRFRSGRGRHRHWE
ncbi:MAG: FecR domain-containing protein [Desulfobacteraceae bacterium]